MKLFFSVHFTLIKVFVLGLLGEILLQEESLWGNDINELSKKSP